MLPKHIHIYIYIYVCIYIYICMYIYIYIYIYVYNIVLLRGAGRGFLAAAEPAAAEPGLRGLRGLQQQYISIRHMSRAS